jgi:hypothetical protein
MAEASFRLGQIDQARSFATDLTQNYPNYLPAKLMEVQINSCGAATRKTAMKVGASLQDRLSKAAPDRDTSPRDVGELNAKT